MHGIQRHFIEIARQNGVDELMNVTILEKTRRMLFNAGLGRI